MTLRTLAGAVALAVMSLAAGLLPAAARADSAANASRAEVQRLVSQFRGASKDPQKRAQLVQQAIQAGPAAAGGIMRAISRELAPDVKRYTAKFSQKAAPLAQKRLAGVKGAEVNALRQTVLGLKDEPNFTHETITAKADPAMKRLREIFLVGRQEVLDKTPALQKDRQKLIDATRLWDQCAACVYQHMTASAQKPPEAPTFERYLCSEEESAAMLAGPMDAATRSILAANAAKAAQLESEEYRAIVEANVTRNLLGLSALEIDLKLCAAAHDHAHDMDTLKFFSHESPVPGKTKFTERTARMGSTASGENIGLGYQDGEGAHQGWFHSPPHQTNMLMSGHKRIGVGRSGGLWTEMFGD